MQEAGIIENIKNVFIGIGTGIIAGGCGGAVTELYSWTKRGKFKSRNFIVSILMGAFAGYIVAGFTNNGALSGLAGALSMKIFDFLNQNSEQLITKYLEKKMGVIIDNNKKNGNK